MTGRVEPAVLGWLVVLGVAGAVDGWLLHSGHSPLSTVCRVSRWGRIGALLLAAHLLCEIPGDPLTYAGSRLTRKS